jgi:hypothetical protein
MCSLNMLEYYLYRCPHCFPVSVRVLVSVRALVCVHVCGRVKGMEWCIHACAVKQDL